MAEAEKKLLALPGLAKVSDRLKTKKEKDDFRRHMRKYINIYLPDCPFEVTTTNRYTGVTHEAAVTARRLIRQGENVRYLSGIKVTLTRDEEKDLDLRRQDFSIVMSSRKKSASLFLGPARFSNHDCNANARLVTMGPHGMEVVAVRDIEVGEEVTVTYGDNYFGLDNRECLCQSCEGMGRNGWISKDAPNAVTPAPEGNQTIEAGPYSFRRKRKYVFVKEEATCGATPETSSEPDSLAKRTKSGVPTIGSEMAQENFVGQVVVTGLPSPPETEKTEECEDTEAEVPTSRKPRGQGRPIMFLDAIRGLLQNNPAQTLPGSRRGRKNAHSVARQHEMSFPTSNASNASNAAQVHGTKIEQHLLDRDHVYDSDSDSDSSLSSLSSSLSFDEAAMTVCSRLRRGRARHVKPRLVSAQHSLSIKRDHTESTASACITSNCTHPRIPIPDQPERANDQTEIEYIQHASGRCPRCERHWKLYRRPWPITVAEKDEEHGDQGEIQQTSGGKSGGMYWAWADPDHRALYDVAPTQSFRARPSLSSSRSRIDSPCPTRHAREKPVSKQREDLPIVRKRGRPRKVVRQTT